MLDLKVGWKNEEWGGDLMSLKTLVPFLTLEQGISVPSAPVALFSDIRIMPCPIINDHYMGGKIAWCCDNFPEV